MPIRNSSGRDIEALIAHLGSSRAVVRDSAIARLTVIGVRAVDRLAAVIASPGSSSIRAAALRALEGIANRRALNAALNAVDDADDVVAVAAISAIRASLRGARGADVVDGLARVALDARRHHEVRLASIQALSDLEPGTLQPLWGALAEDASPKIRREARTAAARVSRARDDQLIAAEAAMHSELSDAETLREAVLTAGHATPLALLHQIVERARTRETSEPANRERWMTTRAVVHLALANRGSRLGVYDLKEWLNASTSPLPRECLTAITLVGDASCLEALAAAFAASGPGQAPRDEWPQHLAAAFRAVATRHGITRRHAISRRIVRRWGDKVKSLGLQ